MKIENVDIASHYQDDMRRAFEELDRYNSFKSTLSIKEEGEPLKQMALKRFAIAAFNYWYFFNHIWVNELRDEINNGAAGDAGDEEHIRVPF